MAPEESQSLLLWVCVWVVRKEGDFVKGVTIQTDSEFFGTERIFFVKTCKVRKIPQDLKESFVTFSL